MTEHDQPPEDLVGYERRIQDALRRGVVRQILEECASAPPPGGHHYYLTFRSDLSEVPADLLAKYPREMTVVIQHQYWELSADDVGFSVTLKFSGVPRRMVVPWHALTRFYDPHVQFLLQWDTLATHEVKAADADASEKRLADFKRAPDEAGVVTLADFRKQR